MDMSDKYCARCGNEVAEGKRFCKECGHDVIAADSVPAPGGICEPVSDDRLRVPSGPALAENQDVEHRALAGSSTFSSSPSGQAGEKPLTPLSAGLAQVTALASALPHGQSRQKIGIAIGFAALVLIAACGSWAWYAYAHRDITLKIKAQSDSQYSTTRGDTPSQSRTDQATGIASIEGKYPFDVIKMPWFKSKLAALLNDKSRREFSARLQVASPVERQGDWLVGKGLAPHSGGSEEAAFAINVNSGAVFGMMMTDGDVFTSIGVDDPAKLPSPLQAWYLERGGSLTHSEDPATVIQKPQASQTLRQILQAHGRSIENAEIVTPRPPVSAPQAIVDIPGGIAVGMLIQRKVALYPAVAKAAHISGTVVLQITISKTGTIENLHVVSGPPTLQQAALDAVMTWRYRPYLLNGEPVEVETTANVIFTLAGQ